MTIRESEMRVWNRMSTQHKAACVACFYVCSALFPVLTATAVLAFLAGRSCGIQSEKLNAQLEAQSRERIRCELLSELAEARPASEKEEEEKENEGEEEKETPPVRPPTPFTRAPLATSIDELVDENASPLPIRRGKRRTAHKVLAYSSYVPSPPVREEEEEEEKEEEAGR